MIQIISPSGATEERKGRPTWGRLGRIVGGNLEILNVAYQQQLLINKKGLLLGLKPNQKASSIARESIFGAAIFLTDKDVIL